MPNQGVVICPNGKYNPVYHILRSYRNENGSPRSDRVAIGKLDVESGKLIPNAKYWEFYGPAEDDEIVLDYVSNRAVGVSFVVSHIMRNLGLTEVLNQCLGEERSRLVHTA